MKRYLFLISIMSGLLLAACGDKKNTVAVSDEFVAEAARTWATATTNAQGVEALGLTCADLRQVAQTENLVGTRLADLLRLRLDSTFETDLSALNFQVVEREGGTAVVQVKGNARLAAFGSEVAVELNEKWTMREEDGRWKWCGSGP